LENPERQLRALALRLDGWLRDSALTLWWEHGADHAKGGFHELLGLDGLPPLGQKRRARVQARQSYVYATAGTLGWTGPWREAAPYGLAFLNRHYRRADGQYCTLVSQGGAVLDDTAMFYDQAFVLLARAALAKVSPDRAELVKAAHEHFALIEKLRRHPAGGFSETGERPFQSNPHMHLLEAALAWCEVEPQGMWNALADEIVALCRTKFIDPEGGFLREFFDAQWRPLAGAPGHIVEPGHQFEWCWLLERWGRLRGDDGARAAARRLFAAGLRGVDPVREAALDELSDGFAVTRAGARLWPQTERAKAALILAETAKGEMRELYLSEAGKAAASLWRYLETDVAGLWRDKQRTDGSFVEEPAPASSFYHIICCIVSLKQALG